MQLAVAGAVNRDYYLENGVEAVIRGGVNIEVVRGADLLGHVVAPSLVQEVERS